VVASLPYKLICEDLLGFIHHRLMDFYSPFTADLVNGDKNTNDLELEKPDLN
jgi:hypothetical protein